MTLTSADVFAAPSFAWRRYLQRHLAHPAVNVTDLHPVMGLRVAALFADLTAAGLADERPGYGVFEVSSGVRTRAQQIALYDDICLRQGRCGYVANPYVARSSGPDAEGVQRYGSNHQAQRQSNLWARALGLAAPPELGYAVDIRNNGAPWAEMHRRLAAVGLDWPLKTGAVEPWHVEAFPDRAPGWLPGPWPTRPGILRPLYRGLIGGDVRRLQRQADTVADGAYGPGTVRAVRRLQRALKRPRTGLWVPADQRAYERDRRRR
jgi:hypothetical protein